MSQIIKKLFRIVSGTALIFLVLFVGWIFINYASRPYENGRYFDPASDTVYEEHTVWVLGIVLMILVVLLALFIAVIRKK